MECPKCKYPNPKGVTYCQLCYEVFSRSAAESYLRNVRREKYEQQKREAADEPMGKVADNAKRLLKKVDWSAGRAAVTRWGTANRRWILGTATFLGLWILWAVFTSPHLHFLLTGVRFRYVLAGRKPTEILLGFHSDVTQWSEKSGGVDTQMGALGVDEIGTLQFIKESRQRVRVEATQWYVERIRNQRKESEVLALKNPVLAPATIDLTPAGAIAQRHVGVTTRLGRSMPFLAPLLPVKTQHKDSRWTETVKWTDILDDFKVEWTGEWAWHLDGEAPCGTQSCAHLSYQAVMHPRVVEGPAWGSFNFKQARLAPRAMTGEALFDTHSGQLFSNTFNYAGDLQIPLYDVSAIPMELRVGRSMHRHIPGTVIVRFSNTVNVRKPER